MAYFTGAANTPADLLLKLKAHAESIGWITDRASIDEWCCHNQDGYWSIKAFNDRLELCGNTGFDNSKAWNNQTGTSMQHRFNTTKVPTHYSLSSSPFIAYHLFATVSYLHLVVEIESGVFRPLFIGTLNKFGTYDGGQYVCGFYKNQYTDGLTGYMNNWPFDGSGGGSYGYFGSAVRVDGQDGAPTPDWLLFNSQFGANRYAIGLGRGYSYDANHPSSLLVLTSANSLTGGTLLIPCTIYTMGAENRTRIIGEVKDFAVCRMDYLSPGDSITVGQDEWRVFPPVERAANDNKGSGMVGYAYKVIN